jgi:hypothetical protein
MKFFRMWSELNAWSRLGIAFVAGAVLLLLILEFT